jgi:hypothetical protein
MATRKRDLRLAIARQAVKDLEDQGITRTVQERLELMKLVERLTHGKKPRKPPRKTVFG